MLFPYLIKKLPNVLFLIYSPDVTGLHSQFSGCMSSLYEQSPKIDLAGEMRGRKRDVLIRTLAIARSIQAVYEVTF